MTSERPAVPSPSTIAEQAKASSPVSSAWVDANAGSGKTHVLTQRVLRLLLAGASPESILCLTYTKAAATVMRNRVADRLGKWALMGREQLATELTMLTGAPPDAAALRRAPTLFAHALETPGGLKINTIHAFCESVLHRFPLEAGVPFDFQVIEEATQREMIDAARERVLAEGLGGKGAAARSVLDLFETLTDSQIADGIDTALAQARQLRSVLADRTAAKTRLRRYVGMASSKTRASLLDEAVARTLFPPSQYGRVFALTPPRPEGKGFEDKLAGIDPAAPTARDLFDAFLTGSGTVPKTFPKKAIKDADAGLAALLADEAARLEDVRRRLTRAELVERSEALIDIVGAIADDYEGQKRARALLDFDDLISRLHTLFTRGEMREWVRYKLDAGISHVLVDEGQDTNPEQWTVVEAIADEFFAGDGVARAPRTLFAVGDPKQSIYSFQGAEPEAFILAGATYRQRAGQAGQPFERVRLTESFRTQKGILDAVDLVCARPDIRSALLSVDEAIRHGTARQTEGGTVTLWPPRREPANERPEDDWPLEAANGGRGAAAEVASAIAAEIRDWIDTRRQLGRRGRAVRADDVLILVQDRSKLFYEIIRALKKERIPTPGADKLAVASHIAVLDLLALGDILLNPADDLTLAAVLRSPLFDIDEDQLRILCHEREGTVWAALAQAAGRHDWARAAHERLRSWRARLDLDRPYELFARILYAEGGLRLFHARLGAEVDDVMAEFISLALAHERGPDPSLQAFLAQTRHSAVEIRRELPDTGSGVRVMTVHGAKGLEAPIVILADAASIPDARKLARSVYIPDQAPAGPTVIFAPTKSDHVPQTMALREAGRERQMAEYWRKLYVGMTRAEDELYVTGVLTSRARIEGSWYDAIRSALEQVGQPCPSPMGEPGLCYPGPAEANRIAGGEQRAEKAAPPAIPGKAPKFERRQSINPSTALVEMDPERLLETRARTSITGRTQARDEGTALHALLHHLAAVPEAGREAIAMRALEVLLPETPQRHAALSATALAILGDESLAHVFGPQSRGEVPFLALGQRDGAPITLSGRIDRLVVDEGRVLIVDFKSDAVPPGSTDEVPPGYVTQMGLYSRLAGRLFPGLKVEAALLWTATRTLMTLPARRMADMTAGFTLE
ncbi:MAG TPA: double-strand break repair helicase AddA [Devosiaceae bacterium]